MPALQIQSGNTIQAVFFSAAYSPSLPVIKRLQICQPSSDSKIFITGDDVRGKRSTAWVLDPRLNKENWCLEKKNHLTLNKCDHYGKINVGPNKANFIVMEPTGTSVNC